MQPELTIIALSLWLIVLLSLTCVVLVVGLHVEGEPFWLAA